MSEAVTSALLRYKFVEKDTSEVGDGTGYPMLATKEQLEEIMYRVRDAKFTQGSVTVDSVNIDDQVGYNSVVQFSYGDLPETLFELREDTPLYISSLRGYCTTARESSPMAAYDTSFFGSAYSSSVTDYITSGIIVEARDIQREAAQLAIFAGVVGNYEEDPTLVDWGVAVPVSRFRTGFSQSLATLSYPGGGSLPDGYFPYVLLDGSVFYNSCSVSLEFTGEVAWVDDDASGNPLSPGNRLYIGVEFGVAIGYDGVTMGTRAIAPENVVSTGAVVKLKLSGTDNEVSMPIYFFPDRNSDPYFTRSITSIDDFIIEATEWFPYAKGSPAVPKWDAATGVLL